MIFAASSDGNFTPMSENQEVGTARRSAVQISLFISVNERIKLQHHIPLKDMVCSI